MSASTLFTRRRILITLVLLVLAVAAVVAAVALRPDADPAAGATQPAGSTASAGTGGEGDPEASETGSDGGEPSDGDPADPADSESDGETGEAETPEPRETLEPRPFDAAATPEPGVTVRVPKVEKVTGEANVPGEVGGPSLRFTVELTNGTGKTLDLRTVVVNAYYGPDRTPAPPLLKPGGKAFEAEAGADDSARGAFVFSIPAEFQDDVELEVDPGVGKAIVIFTGA